MISRVDLNEQRRLQKLNEYQILDTPPESAFDELAQLAAFLAATPIATITLIDEHRQWFKSRIGLTLPETDRSIAICDHTIRNRKPLIVPDTRLDSRFANNPLVVGEPFLRAYAGIPLVCADGVVVGTLAVMDVVPATLSDETIAKLETIGRQVVTQLELRLFGLQQARMAAAREEALSRSEAMHQSEVQYRLLFMHNPHPMWVYEVPSLRFLAVNDAAIAHYGYSEQEFLQMTLHDIRPSADHARFVANVAQRISRTNFGTWRHIKKDGTLIEVEIRSDEITFNGRDARIVLASDVTARKRAEEKIREQAALLDKAQDAIMVLDLNYRITYGNQSAERLYGWKLDEVLGRRVDELLHKDPVAFQLAYGQLFATGEWKGEFAKRTRDGRERLIEARWTLVHDDDGRPRSILAIDTDITERKKLEAQFLRAQRMESIGTLAGGIAHDLNNVLAPILMAVGMLKLQPRSPGELKLLNLLESSAQKGAAMIRQVLTFARGIDGQRTLVQVDAVVMDLARLVHDTFDRNIRVTTDLPSYIWPVLGDPTQIHQLLLNLCVNARDAMPEGGELRLSASNMEIDAEHARMNTEAKAGQYVLLKVADSGTGIPAEIRDRVFEPFFTTKEIGKGTGLGLATVQAVVKSHDGYINVYSEEGRGTEFRIYLPAYMGERSKDVTVVSMTLPRGSGETVLVIDDEEAVRLTTQQTLEAFGYRVLLAEDGADALALYIQSRHEIAVVLTDMMMPVMDGFATIQALRKLNPDVKIAAASGLATNSMVAKAANAGVKHFLAKPYTADAMLRVLAEILGKSAKDLT